MKNKIAIASAFLAASSFSTAEIVINDFLSFEGFVDMSYTHTDTDNPDSSGNNFGVDQVEISWLFDFDPVTAQVDFTHLGSDNDRVNRPFGGNTGVEQAFATYHLDDSSAITAGLYASMLGFEAFEPTGLYQYSFAYDIGVLLPGYANGVKYTIESDTSFFGVSLQDEAQGNGENSLGGSGNSSYAIEVAGSLMLGEGLTGFIGAAFEEADTGDTYVVNSYLTYETGAWVFAAELNYGQTDSDPLGLLGVDPETDVFSGLLMANFAYSDVASVTGRVSYIDVDGDDSVGGSFEDDWIKFTLAHGYAFTDNLFLVNEVSYSEFDSGQESLFGAAELIFSF